MRADLRRGTVDRMSDLLTLTAVFTPDENGWTMAQVAEWPAVVTCGRTVEEAREMLLDAACEMVASYRDESRQSAADMSSRSRSTSPPLEAA
jgi:predicted RNase H-like HicB family nuclease